MVEWICRHYRQRAIRVAILSRGYGSTGGLNDEGLVLFDNLPDVPHLQAPDRVELARIAVEELESQLLVLDDGFQHRRLARDLDVVLLDALDPFGGGRLLPRGLLREPVSSLGRAGVIVLSRADQVDQSTRESIRREVVRRLGREAAWVEARHAPRDLIDERVESAPMTDLVGRSILAFCGIGNPHAFARTLSDAGANVIEFVEFADHHDYRREDVEGLIARVERSGADLALTTQKDLVKLRIGSLGRAPLRALRIGLEILDGSQALTAALDGVIPEAQNSAT
jgi:tetraacyldisaccharide 4'-kinase